MAKTRKKGLGSKSKKLKANARKAKAKVGTAKAKTAKPGLKAQAAGSAPPAIYGTCTVYGAGPPVTGLDMTKQQCREWAGPGVKYDWVPNKK